jgi:uncharacterized membrane protein
MTTGRKGNEMPFNSKKPSREPSSNASADVTAESIQAIADLVARREAQLSRGQRAIESFTQTIGRPRFLYINAALIIVWVILNTWTLQHPVDRWPFNGLCLLVGVEALFVAGLVLITQNRQGAEMDRRAHLDLQINLLSEREITKILTLLEELIRHHQPEREHDAELAAMKETVDLGVMLTALDSAMDSAMEQITLEEEAPERGDFDSPA